MSPNDQILANTTARIAHALAHPVRVQILELLRDEGAYVMHLTAMLGRPQANISQHLAVLREAGLVTAEREGMTVIYHVRAPQVFEALDCLQSLAGSRIHAEEVFNLSVFSPGPRRMARGSGYRCHCPRCRRKCNEA